MTKKSKDQNVENAAKIDGRLIETMAKACHEANRALEHHNDNKTVAHWDEATTDERSDLLNYVEGYLNGELPKEPTQKDRLYIGIIDALATED